MKSVSLKILSYKGIISKDLTGTEFNIKTGYLLVNEMIQIAIYQQISL